MGRPKAAQRRRIGAQIDAPAGQSVSELGRSSERGQAGEFATDGLDLRSPIHAKSGLMGRRTAASLRTLAGERDWLATEQPAPDDATIAEALAPSKRAITTVSTLEPHRERIAAWLAQGVSGVVIHTVLKREHGFTGHYSAVRRMLDRLKQDVPPKTTVRLNFAPGEAAQVDFGAGPTLEHPAGGQRRTWAFVMTLCFSRHQYVEFVWDQTVAT